MTDDSFTKKAGRVTCLFLASSMFPLSVMRKNPEYYFPAILSMMVAMSATSMLPSWFTSPLSRVMVIVTGSESS